MKKAEKLNNAETQALNIPDVVGSVSDIQYCKDCVNYPCNSYEKSVRCRTCTWNGRNQSKFERRLD
jgi:hypothetical protein